MECSICCETINKSSRALVKCIYCEYIQCKSCFQRYLTDTTLDAHCVNCKKSLNCDFLRENCTSIFITKVYKNHRENILLNREKSLLPETQPYVLIRKKQKEIHSKILEINIKNRELMKQMIENKRTVNYLYRELLTLNINNTNNNVSQDKKFIWKCPVSDCRGFLNTNWVCGICENKICNKCNEIKKELHECKEDDIETMKLLHNNTKPCPKCATMISRVSGCSQIWCPGCHTAWNWNTGQIETGIIHNPHYYDFIRQQNGGNIPRNIGDIPCGGLPYITEIQRYIRSSKIVFSEEIVKKIYSIHNIVSHVNHMIRPVPEINTLELRIDFLTNDIDETKFKKILQQKEKQRNKDTDFVNIYQMFVDVCSDIFRQILVNNSLEFVKTQIQIFENLILYFNDNLKKIGSKYKCVYPGINPKVVWEYNYETYLKREELINNIIG